MGVVRSSTGITQCLTACQTIDTECTTLAYPATICMDCLIAEVTDDETSITAPKTSQQTSNKEMEEIRPVTPTEVEQMKEQIFKDKESEPITYEEEDLEEEDLHTYAQDTQLLRARVLSPPAIKQIELLSTFKPHRQLIRVFYHSILYCY